MYFLLPGSPSDALPTDKVWASLSPAAPAPQDDQLFPSLLCTRPALSLPLLVGPPSSSQEPGPPRLLVHTPQTSDLGECAGQHLQGRLRERRSQPEVSGRPVKGRGHWSGCPRISSLHKCWALPDGLKLVWESTLTEGPKKSRFGSLILSYNSDEHANLEKRSDGATARCCAVTFIRHRCPQTAVSDPKSL